VLYGLFGYAWMKSRYEPSVGIYLPRDVVVIMIAWLFLCMTGRVGPIANAAHVAGFVVGIVVGIAPFLWRKIFRR
jgi:GlpG protein